MNVTLITGASSGLGLEFAKLYAKDKNNLLLIARNKEKLNELKNEFESKYQIQVFILPCDLSLKESISKIENFILENKLNVNILINNAGFGDFNKFVDSDINKQNQMINLNILALVNLIHLIANQMVKNKEGKILNVCSIAAFQSGPLMSVYYATKAFVLSFTQAISYELKKDNIKVIALCPGLIDTGFEKSSNLDDSKLFKSLKIAKPIDVAKYGYKKLNKNKTISIYGISNKLIIMMSKFSPRKLVTKVVYNIQKKK